MYDFSVKSFRGEYAVAFKDDLPASLTEGLKAGDLVILDRNVKQHHSDSLVPLDGVDVIEVAASEALKSYRGLEPIISRVIEAGFRRGNRLVAIGGGVVQDTTAFIASVLYRGVEWVFYPTTLLAQADSCIGSKTSINFGAFKNQLGGFYPPSRIVIHAAFLQSLPEGDFMSGIGEMYHYFLIAGRADFEWFNQALSESASRDIDVLKPMIRKSLEIKRQMVERDEFDRRERQVFNYGHTFGHAVETLTEYRVPHGIAVAFGMDMANVASESLGLLPAGVRAEIRPFLANVWKNHSLDGISAADMVEAMGKDKKNAGNRLGLILTRGYGNMVKQQTDREVVAEVLERYFEDMEQ